MSSRYPVARRTLTPRQTLIAGGGLLLILALIVGAILWLAGRDDRPEDGAQGSPTARPATLTPSPSAVVTPTEVLPPTLTPTLEPYTYTVQAGETLGFIIQLFGYRDFAVIPEVLALNNLASENDIFEGQLLQIPRQTPTPGPTADPSVAESDLTQPPPSDGGAEGDFRGCDLTNRCISPDGQFWMHAVSEGETISGLAFAYDTTVPAIQQDNNAIEFIFPGQILQIRILVSPTPTLTPTGGPDSTATLTPTYSPPTLLVPADGTTVARGANVVLQWVPIQPIRPEQSYLIVLRDEEGGEEYRYVTRANILRMPEERRPAGGRSISYSWQVVIVNGATLNAPVIGGQGPAFTFTWG
jgi:LysM repeat protein